MVEPVNPTAASGRTTTARHVAFGGKHDIARPLALATMAMMDHQYAAYFDSLSGMPISHAWRGYGSAIFLEFGRLTPAKNRDGSPALRRDGSSRNTKGDMEAMIESGWHIDGDGGVVADSRSAGPIIQRSVDELIGLCVVSVQAVGSPPELEIKLTTGRTITTFAEEELASQWTLFDRRSPPTKWLHVREGSLTEEVERQR